MISWVLPGINDNTTFDSKWFRVRSNNAQGIQVTNKAAAEYIDSYWNDREVRYSNQVSSSIATATPSVSPTMSATYTITQTHTISPTFTITPTYTATPLILALSVTGVFPNPAIIKAHIVYNLTADAKVLVRIYTLSGEFVVQLDGSGLKGNNSITWNLKNRQGNNAASGTYLYTIEAVSTRGGKQKANGQLSVAK
jgi:hypothetical protein